MGVATLAWLGILDGYESYVVECGKPRRVEPWLRRIPGRPDPPRTASRHESCRPLSGLLPPLLAPGDHFGPQPAQVLLVLAELRRLGCHRLHVLNRAARGLG